MLPEQPEAAFGQPKSHLGERENKTYRLGSPEDRNRHSRIPLALKCAAAIQAIV